MPSWSEPLNQRILRSANPTTGIITSDKEEWELMVRKGPDGTWHVNNQTRSGTTMCNNFMEHEMTIKAGLTLEEVVALRLYTGPAFHKYNTHLRFGLSEATKEGGAPPLKKERHYTTTIHAIASALKKVARVTKLPEVLRLSLSLSLSPHLPLSLSCTFFLSCTFLSLLLHLFGSVGLKSK